MKTRALALTAAWSIGTFALAMALGLPGNLNAGDQPTKNLAVGKPTLTVNGVNFTVDVAPPTAGSPLDLTVNATNPGNTSETATVGLRLFTSSIPSPMSRTMSMPVQQWKSDPQTITLAPGESTKVDLKTLDVTLNNQTLNLTLNGPDGAISVYTMGAGMTVPATQPSIIPGNLAASNITVSSSK